MTWGRIVKQFSFVAVSACVLVRSGALPSDGPNCAPVESQTSGVADPSASVGGVIEGRVYDSDGGTGIPNVEVVVTAGRNRSALSGADGRYRIEGLAAGIYRIHCKSPLGIPMENMRMVAVRVALGAATKADIPISLGAAISGQVVTEDGTPIEGAAVAAIWQQESRCDDVTGADGMFALRGFKTGEPAFLLVTHSGFMPIERENFIVPREGLHELRLLLRPAAHVQGTVTDAEGRPAVDAVVITKPTSTRYAGKIPPSVFSDSAGDFVIPWLEPGSWTICTRRKDVVGEQLEARQTVEVRATETFRMSFRLPPIEELHIAGIVRDSSGSPVLGANLWAQVLERTDSGLALNPIVSRTLGTTDAHGFFDLVVHQQGRFRVVAYGMGFRPIVTDVDAGNTAVELLIASPGAIEGYVVSDRTGLPLPEFEILTSQDSPSPRFPTLAQHLSFEAISDPEGRFLMRDVVPGDVTVYVRAPGYAVNWAVVKVGAAEAVQGVVFRLAEGATVKGTVRNAEGAPLPNVPIFVGDLPKMYESGWGSNAATDASGMFVLEHMPLGLTTISAYDDVLSLTSDTVTLQTGNLYEANLIFKSAGSISGRVTQGSDPVLHARVVAIPRGDGTSLDTITDSDGFYRIYGLQSRTYEVNVETRSDGYTPMLQATFPRIDVSDAESKLDMNIPAAAVTVEGSVTNENESAVSAFIGGSVVTADGQSIGFAMQLEDVEASYTIQGLPAGVITMSAELRLLDGAISRVGRAEIDANAGGTYRNDLHFPSVVLLRVNLRGDFSDRVSVGIVEGVVTFAGANISDLVTQWRDVGAHNKSVSEVNRFANFSLQQRGPHTVFARGTKDEKPVAAHAVVDVDGTESLEVELHLEER